MLKKIGILLAFIAAVAGLAYGYARTHRPATVRGYYKLQRKWSDRGWQSRASMLASMEPFLLRIGVLGPARVQVEPGISYFLDPRDLVPATILKTGEWQPEIWDSLAASLPQGGVFYDVGAHIGYYSMKAAARVGASGRVVSFEPNPETVALLRDNVSANRFPNIVVEPIACTDRDQMLTLFAAPEANTGASSLSKENASISQTEAPKGYSVRGRPIDDVTAELGLARVDVIKIDVEGAEGLVLRGALKTLERFHPKVVLEVVPRQLASFNTTPEDLAALFRGAGYNFSRPLSSDQTDWEWTAQPLLSMVRMNDAAAERQLLRGFYPIEGGAWRWSAKTFAAQFKPGGSTLVLEFTIPDAVADAMKDVTLTARVGGVEVGSESYASAGPKTFRHVVPARLLNSDAVQVEFSLTKSVFAAGRVLGVIVTSVGFE